MEELDRIIDQIENYPEAGSPYLSGTRRFLMRRFPFFVVYRERHRGLRDPSPFYRPVLRSFTQRRKDAKKGSAFLGLGCTPCGIRARAGRATGAAAAEISLIKLGLFGERRGAAAAVQLGRGAPFRFSVAAGPNIPGWGDRAGVWRGERGRHQRNSIRQNHQLHGGRRRLAHVVQPDGVRILHGQGARREPPRWGSAGSNPWECAGRLSGRRGGGPRHNGSRARGTRAEPFRRRAVRNA